MCAQSKYGHMAPQPTHLHCRYKLKMNTTTSPTNGWKNGQSGNEKLKKKNHNNTWFDFETKFGPRNEWMNDKTWNALGMWKGWQFNLCLCLYCVMSFWTLKKKISPNYIAFDARAPHTHTHTFDDKCAPEQKRGCMFQKSADINHI